MNEKTILGRLMWKDIMTIKSLLLAAAIGIVAVNLLILFVWRIQENPGDSAPRWLVETSIIWWILIPELVALGAPPMLVGTEEETGTLAWLRTLPVGWQRIAAAKFLVALAGVTAVWIAASIVLWLHTFLWRESILADRQSLVAFTGMMILGFYCLSLLSLGFVFIYLIRAPLPAMFALVPTFFLYIIVTANLEEYFLETRGGNVFVSGGGVLLAMAILSSLWLCQAWLARRRLQSPRWTIPLPSGSPMMTQYRAPVLRFVDRPSPVGSLLWQQMRQTGPLCVTLIAVSVFLSILISIELASQGDRVGVRLFEGLSPIFVLLGASWFGAVVFYGDNVGRRRGFFADRGIGPTRVWWTRMAPPAVGFMLTWLLLGLVSQSFTQDILFRHAGAGFLDVVVLASVMFAFGQLVSQWSERPILAFFAAPAYTLISLSPLLYLMDRFQSDFAVIALTIPVLLLASWQLTGRWLEGRVNGGYTARVLAYTAVAVLIPCLWVIVSDRRSRRYAEAHLQSVALAPSGGGVSFQSANARQAESVPHAHLSLASDKP